MEPPERVDVVIRGLGRLSLSHVMPGVKLVRACPYCSSRASSGCLPFGAFGVTLSSCISLPHCRWTRVMSTRLFEDELLPLKVQGDSSKCRF